MKLARLLQPRNPLFWIMLVLNALSSVLTFVLHSRELPLPATLLLTGLALANAVIGIALALRLMADNPQGAPHGRM